MIGKTRHAAPASADAPRGVLHTRLEAGAFEHARLAPSPALAACVEHYWCVRWDLRGRPPQLQETLPHPNVHLVIEHGEARVWGVHDGRYRRVLEGRETVFGVKFAAGGFRALLGAPVATLANRSRPAREVFGAAIDALVPAVPGCADIVAMVTLVEPLLLANAPPPDPLAAQARVLVAQAASDRELLRAEQLAERAGLGLRALQRLFRDYVGASPKWVIKRYRLHEAVAQLQAGRELALDRAGAGAGARLLEPVQCLHVARVALEWPSGGGAWRSACLAGRPSRALPHGGHSRATRRAGSVCPHPCVITRSWTDVHSSLLNAESVHGLSPRALLLPWSARKQLPARATRRH